MPWKDLKEPPPDPGDPVYDEIKRKSRFLVDESMGEHVAKALQNRGFNTVFVGDVGLDGHDDQDVSAFAWKEERLLLTHDRDFLDDAQFPEHRNPGVIILPGGGGDLDALTEGVATVLAQFSIAPGIWRKSKIVVSPTGEMSIRNRNNDTGKIETTRYRFRRGKYAQIWEDDAG